MNNLDKTNKKIKRARESKAIVDRHRDERFENDNSKWTDNQLCELANDYFGRGGHTPMSVENIMVKHGRPSIQSIHTAIYKMITNYDDYCKKSMYGTPDPGVSILRPMSKQEYAAVREWRRHIESFEENPHLYDPHFPRKKKPLTIGQFSALLGRQADVVLEACQTQGYIATGFFNRV